MPAHRTTPPTVIALLLLTACRARPAAEVPGSEPSAQAVPVILEPIADTALSQPIVATGVLGAKEEVPLGFKIGGVIARVLVDGGETVRAGELLAELEQPEIGAEVAKAGAAVNQAERDLVRAEALYRDSVITRERFEAAGTAAEVARANLRIARFNERYAAIRAPAGGTVLRRLAEPGQQVAPGSPVLVLAISRRGQVLRVGLVDRDAARIIPGDKAVARFETLSGEVAGRVVRLAAGASAGTGTWEVEVALDHTIPAPAGGMASGLIGEVSITPGRKATVKLVPLASVLEGDGDSAVVWSIATASAGAPSVARRHVVRIAFLDGDRAAVSRGLDGADSVVTAGAGYLSDGMPVTVVASPVAPEGAGARAPGRRTRMDTLPNGAQPQSRRGVGQ